MSQPRIGGARSRLSAHYLPVEHASYGGVTTRRNGHLLGVR